MTEIWLIYKKLCVPHLTVLFRVTEAKRKVLTEAGSPYKVWGQLLVSKPLQLTFLSNLESFISRDQLISPSPSRGPSFTKSWSNQTFTEWSPCTQINCWGTFMVYSNPFTFVLSCDPNTRIILYLFSGSTQPQGLGHVYQGLEISGAILECRCHRHARAFVMITGSFHQRCTAPGWGQQRLHCQTC